MHEDRRDAAPGPEPQAARAVAVRDVAVQAHRMAPDADAVSPRGAGAQALWREAHPRGGRGDRVLSYWGEEEAKAYCVGIRVE